VFEQNAEFYYIFFTLSLFALISKFNC